MEASEHTSQVGRPNQTVQSDATGVTQASRPSSLTGATSARGVRRRSRRGIFGAIAVEYAFLLVAVAVPISMAISAGGFAMLRQYLLARNMILEPDP